MFRWVPGQRLPSRRWGLQFPLKAMKNHEPGRFS
jgi:hypothetical protein